MSPSIGPDLSLPLSIFLSIIIFILFLLMLGGIYMLFSFHRKKALSPAAVNAPILSDEWFSGYASMALSSNSSIFGRLFAQPKEDGNEWILLKEVDQRFLWVCKKTAKMGFWTLDVDGSPLWREVSLDQYTLAEYFLANKNTQV